MKGKQEKFDLEKNTINKISLDKTIGRRVYINNNMIESAAPERSLSCCGGDHHHQQPACRHRRRRQETCSALFTMTLLILSAVLPSATTASSSTTPLLRGKKKSLHRGLPQHGTQRPSTPPQYDEHLRKLILIASSSRNHGDGERDEARRRLANMMDTNADVAATNSEKQPRELAATSNTRNKLSPQQRASIKLVNAERKKENAMHEKKQQPQSSAQQQQQQGSNYDEKQTDGKFSFGAPPPPPPPPPEKPNSASGSFSAYQSGKSMADSFVNSMISSFVSDGSGTGGGDSGPSPTPPTPNSDEGETQESSGSYTITQGSIVSSLQDTSTQIDGFEQASKLNWEFPMNYPWKVTGDVSYEGKSSVMSGLPPSSSNAVVGKSLYSNLTLSLDDEDLNQAVGKGGGGAVLSFQLKSTVSWPISAFMVTINDEIVLSPSDVESSASRMRKRNEWAEFSIVIDTTAYSSSSNYDVKFIHVANPLQLEKLPDVPSASELYMDDVRLAPFTRKSELLDMITSGSNGAKWRDMSGVLVAKSDGIDQETGYADLTFVVYSKLGGRLKYDLKTSTQGPFDDLTILFNGQLQDSQFGQSAEFEYIQEEEFPSGKVEVTFRHRKNPGKLDAKILEGLGGVKTDGTNRVKNIEFWAKE